MKTTVYRSLSQTCPESPTLSGIFRQVFGAVVIFSLYVQNAEAASITAPKTPSKTAPKGTAKDGDSAAQPLPPGVRLLQKGTAIEGSPELFVYSFENGIRLQVLPDSRNPLVSLRLKLDAGSNREVLGKTGLAHFFEHMMFRKTRSRDEGHFDRTLAGVGGSGNASTSTDYVSYESTFPAPALDTLLQLERERFAELDLKDPFFTVEKGAVISERSLRYDNDPSMRGSEILNGILEKGSPYEWMTIGAKKDIEDMKIADAEDFYKNLYTPDNLQITVGGPLAKEVFVEKVHKAFGDWKAKRKLVEGTFPSDYLTRHNGKSFICSEAVFEKRIQVAFPTNDNSYQSNVLMNVLNSILSSHPEGDLNYRMNSKKLATGVYVYKESWQKKFQPNMIMLRLSAQQSEDEAEKFVWKALEEARNRPIDDKIKNLVLKQWDVDEAEASSRMTTLVRNYEWNAFFFGDPFVSLKDRTILKELNSQQFRKWYDSSFSKKNSFRYGVVPKTAGIPECSQWKGGVK